SSLTSPLSLHDALPISRLPRADEHAWRPRRFEAPQGQRPQTPHGLAPPQRPRPECLARFDRMTAASTKGGNSAKCTNQATPFTRSEEHTSELQSRSDLV